MSEKIHTHETHEAQTRALLRLKDGGELVLDLTVTNRSRARLRVSTTDRSSPPIERVLWLETPEDMEELHDRLGLVIAAMKTQVTPQKPSGGEGK